MSRIYHTMGVYSDGSRKHNGVREENIEHHIQYNISMRPGRGFFVDGVCKHKGYLSDEEVAKVEAEMKENPRHMKADTAPINKEQHPAQTTSAIRAVEYQAVVSFDQPASACSSHRR